MRVLVVTVPLVLLAACTPLENGPIDVEFPQLTGPSGVIIVATTTGHSSWRSSASATFATSADELVPSVASPWVVPEPLGCRSRRAVDGCEVLTCEGATRPYPYPHAGSLAFGEWTLEPDEGTGEYTGLAYEAGGPIEPGVALPISASGGDVPSFSVEIAPLQPFETPGLPAVEGLEPLPLSWSQTLELQWTEGAGRPTLVRLIGVDERTYTQASCAFDSQAEVGRVPVSVLSELGGLGYGSIEVSRLDVSTTTVGEFELALVGQSQAASRQVSWHD